MPHRKIPLITQQYYHIFNRSVDKQTIFTKTADYSRAVQSLYYYSFVEPPVRYARFLQMSIKEKTRIWNALVLSKKSFSLLSYCFMPNHFHILAQQTTDEGISRALANFQNSYTRYFNTKYKRAGPLWQGPFKVVRIEDENQLLHVSRYIHLNPYSSYIVKSLQNLDQYPWSSLSEYIGRVSKEVCEKDLVLSLSSGKHNYEKFIYDHADYQRTLETIKHLTLE